MNAGMCVCMHVCIYLEVDEGCDLCVYACMHVQMHVYVCMCVKVRLCVCVYQGM